MKKHTLKVSFRLKITLFITCSIALALFSCWMLNHALLETYYVRSQKALIREIYSKINKEISVVDENELSDEQKAVLDRYELSSNVEIYLFTEVSKESFFGPMYFSYFVYPTVTTISDKERFDYLGLSAMQTDKREMTRIIESYMCYTFPRVDGLIQNIVTLEKNDNYQIMSQYDTSLQSDFMDIYGKLDCGYFCFVRVGLEGLSEAAAIANRFMFIVGATLIAVSIVVSVVFTRRFAKPVIELSNIAKRMSKLDFDAKYKVTTNDEIGDLGNSMNSLSSTLETTISELKQANLELQSDIEKKVEIENMRTEFLSNVTHELKTPIAIIQGYAEGLKDCVNDDDASRDYYCEVIADEAAKMNKMVKNLLSLSKIESGGIPVDVARFNLTDVISSVVGSLEILAKQKDAVIEFDTATPHIIWADEYMVEEVVSNYLSNAIHHIDGEKRITITVTEDNDVARLSVFNTGECIPEEDIDKIWIKFYKVDKARTREYGGTGIGLSIVKAIMDTHHREYGVVNHENGVEFWAEFDCTEK